MTALSCDMPCRMIAAGGMCDDYLNMIQIFPLLLLTEAAVLYDLSSGRIPNSMILAGLGMGLIYQTVWLGPAGILVYLGGVLLPLLLLGTLYYFRMIGAGDIKLLCVAGGFVGPAACFSCIVCSILLGGVISLILTLYYRNLLQRFLYFFEYMGEYTRTKTWCSYLQNTDSQARFCFSVPVFLSILCYIGGII